MSGDAGKHAVRRVAWGGPRTGKTLRLARGVVRDVVACVLGDAAALAERGYQGAQQATLQANERYRDALGVCLRERDAWSTAEMHRTQDEMHALVIGESYAKGYRDAMRAAERLALGALPDEAAPESEAA